jgi:hypothetical protein
VKVLWSFVLIVKWGGQNMEITKTRICKGCNSELPLTDDYFYKRPKIGRDGEVLRLRYCRKCKSEQHKIYRTINLDKIHKAQREHHKLRFDHIKRYRDTHSEEIKQTIKEWRTKNKDKIAQQTKDWIKEHKEERKEWLRSYCRNRYLNDIEYKIQAGIRSRLHKKLKCQNALKCDHTINLLGCSIEELKKYLESKFISGMTWNNYGEWHIDHIKPCASYDLTLEDEQKKCFHYTNLQPLWAIDNISKSSFYNGIKY